MSPKFLLLFIIIAIYSFSIKQEDKYVIPWNENRPLTWNDFKGEPQKRFAAASTSYEILHSAAKNSNDQASVKIEAVFFCKNSWKKNEWISDDILTHEQKHFDIVEIYARKMRKMIKAKTYHNIGELKVTMDSIYKVIEKEMDVYQDRYDDESDGSMNGDKQREWNVRLKKELKALDEYSPAFFSVTFQ